MKNPDYVKAFTECKQFLWDGNPARKCASEWICNAIEIAAEHRLVTHEQMRDAKHLISDRLNGRTFRCWLRENISEDQYDAATTVDVQTHRRRWVESMIVEFS